MQLVEIPNYPFKSFENKILIMEEINEKLEKRENKCNCYKLIKSMYIKQNT